jgi:uncharacterized repeat protein (TIGR03803 family)
MKACFTASILTPVSCGTVFKITTSGVKSSVLNGLLYGTTFSGGANVRGTVFSLSL